MYIYIQSEKYLWTVGFYDPKGHFVPESDYSSREEAAMRVHWLNGGSVFPNLCNENDDGE